MRHWLLLITLGTILLLVAACGNDDDIDAEGSESTATATVPVVNETQTAAPTSETDPAPTAMPTVEPTVEPDPTPTATEGSASESGGEESNPEAESSPEDTGETAEEGAGEAGELDTLLLTVDDLPDNWTETVIEMGADGEVGDINADPFQEPCGDQPIEEVYDPVDEASRYFQGTELGPYLTQQLIQFGSSDEASAMIDQVRTLYECGEWVETDEFGGELTFSVNEAEIQDVGDSVFALRLGLAFGDEPEMDMFGNFGFDLVFLQRDEFVSILMYVDTFGMSEMDFPSVVGIVDQKLQR